MSNLNERLPQATATSLLGSGAVCNGVVADVATNHYFALPNEPLGIGFAGIQMALGFLRSSEPGRDSTAGNLLPQNDCALVVEANQMQGVLARINANGVCDCSGCLMGHGDVLHVLLSPRGP